MNITKIVGDIRENSVLCQWLNFSVIIFVLMGLRHWIFKKVKYLFCTYWFRIERILNYVVSEW